MAKKELEFQDFPGLEWQQCEGKVPSLRERILVRDPENGMVTRLLRFEPGTDTSPNGVLKHDFWEEVYILEGSITDLRLNRTFTKGMYACRPPGMLHGPWTTKDGCTTFEVRYTQKQALNSHH